MKTPKNYGIFFQNRRKLKNAPLDNIVKFKTFLEFSKKITLKNFSNSPL